MVEVSRALMKGRSAAQQRDAVIAGFPQVPAWFRRCRWLGGPGPPAARRLHALHSGGGSAKLLMPAMFVAESFHTQSGAPS